MFCYLLFIKFTGVDPANILVDDKGNFKLRVRLEHGDYIPTVST